MWVIYVYYVVLILWLCIVKVISGVQKLYIVNFSGFYDGFKREEGIVVYVVQVR